MTVAHDREVAECIRELLAEKKRLQERIRELEQTVVRVWASVPKETVPW